MFFWGRGLRALKEGEKAKRRKGEKGFGLISSFFSFSPFSLFPFSPQLSPPALPSNFSSINAPGAPLIEQVLEFRYFQQQNDAQVNNQAQEDNPQETQDLPCQARAQPAQQQVLSLVDYQAHDQGGGRGFAQTGREVL